MSGSFTVEYSEPLVRVAVTRFWLRSLGWRFCLPLLVLLLLVTYQVARGDRSWWVGLLGGIVCIGLAIAIAGWLAQRRRALDALRDLEEGKASFTVGEDRLVIRTARAAAELPWKTVREVWRYPDLWFLVYSPNSFSTLPLRGVPAEALEQIENRVRGAGGKVA